jgi:hypothetical protein
MEDRKSILFAFSNTNFVTVPGIDGTGSQRSGVLDEAWNVAETIGNEDSRPLV